MKQLHALLSGTILLASLSGCNTVAIPAALDCSALIGPTLRADVKGADLPENTLGGWVAFGDAQTARLDDANARRAAVVEITDRCAAEQKRIGNRGWWPF